MNRTRVVFLLVFGSVTAFLVVERSLPGLIVFVPLTLIGYLFTSDEANAEMFNNDDDDNTDSSNEDDSATGDAPAQPGLTYIGSQLDFTDEYITDSLIKYISYLIYYPSRISINF